MKVISSKSNKECWVKSVAEGEAFTFDECCYIRLPLFNGPSGCFKIFKESIKIPVWNITRNYTSHMDEDIMVIPVDGEFHV